MPRQRRVLVGFFPASYPKVEASKRFSQLGFFGPQSSVSGTIFAIGAFSSASYLTPSGGVRKLHGSRAVWRCDDYLLQASIMHDTRLITSINYGDNNLILTTKHEINSAVGMNIENLNSSTS